LHYAQAKDQYSIAGLVTLNDPTYIEAARVLGEQMTRIDDKQKAITETYRKLTGRMPLQKEVIYCLSFRRLNLKNLRNIPKSKRVGLQRVSIKMIQNWMSFSSCQYCCGQHDTEF
jgi:hypothetical protein